MVLSRRSVVYACVSKCVSKKYSQWDINNTLCYGASAQRPPRAKMFKVGDKSKRSKKKKKKKKKSKEKNVY